MFNDEEYNEKIKNNSNKNKNDNDINKNSLIEDKCHDDCCDENHEENCCSDDNCNDDCCDENHEENYCSDDCCEDDCHDDDCHDDHCHEAGCSCEHGLLEHIDEEKSESSKAPYIIMGTGIILIAIGKLLEYFIVQPSFSLGFFHTENLISLIIFLVVILAVGNGVIIEGIKSLFKGKIKMELLMTIATIGAFLLGDGFEGASLMVLYYLAEYIESLALDRSKKSLTKLVNLNPDKATLKKDGKEVEVAVEDLKIGDTVVVRPGDKIPIDGEIMSGTTSINQASITGESLAVDKKIGDEVYSSTINEEGYIEVEVRKTSKNTIFSKIIDLIKESEEKKAKIDLFIDKFASYYTPLMVVLAILVVVIPYLFFQGDLVNWIKKSLILLVISCPCALAISTPVSMVSAITAGTKNGIIIKGGEYIEELNRIKAILFDKTGTLTEGKLEISSIDPIDNVSKEELVLICCSIENMSKHPISHAFKNYAQENKIKLQEVSNFQSIVGKGLIGVINNEKYLIGKKEMFIDLNNDEISKKLSNETFKNSNDTILNNKQGKTEVFIGTESKILGTISLKDKLRIDAKDTIESLKIRNIETIMLTGDNEAVAEDVSNTLGLNGYYGNLLPEDKLKKIESLAKSYGSIAMVGDGVNDTPSLARANVGIAMGIGGADVAIETADIVLMNDNLSKIDQLISIAKKTMLVVKENVFIVIAVKAILVILAILGYITLLEAIIIGDTGLALLVVLNSFRIGR